MTPPSFVFIIRFFSAMPECPVLEHLRRFRIPTAQRLDEIRAISTSVCVLGAQGPQDSQIVNDIVTREQTHHCVSLHDG